PALRFFPLSLHDALPISRRLFDVSYAVVSLVDARRQWFKSAPGLALRETGRDVSFCGHAILGDGLMVVPDAWLDPRFRDNPMVLDRKSTRLNSSHVKISY